MDIHWDDARLFLAVAESGSLSAAARTLRMSQPTISRRLAELEAMLGETLFERGVAGSRLTLYGASLVEPARKMADWAGEFTRAAERRGGPVGVVRITAAPGVAHAFLVPFAAAFAADTPGIRLDIASTVRPLDMTRREADIALRLGAAPEVEPAAVIALELRPFASREYAANIGRTTSPSKIAWIGWAPPFDDVSPNTALRRRFPGWEPRFASDDYLLQMRACEVGLGAMLLPQAHPRYRAHSRLVELDVDFAPIRRVVTLLCPRSAATIPRVRAVLAPLTVALREWEVGKDRSHRETV